ncbi:unnamed protein product [Meganyctiphanes norvegica]|uniref:Uncharacterized protein n=1 Tax=Meganyctiphanes norvegica TaxID=48144 RepID=A0AAV2R231_MEGNR
MWIFNGLLIVWCFSLQDYLPIALAALALIFYSVFFKYAREDISELSADCLCEKNKWCKGYEKGLHLHKVDAKKTMADPEFQSLLKSIESQSIIFESESTGLSRNPSLKTLDSRNISRNPSFKGSDSRNISRNISRNPSFKGSDSKIVSRNASFTSGDRSRKVSVKSKDVSRSSSFNSRVPSRSSSFKTPSNINSNNNGDYRVRMTTIRQESVTDTLHGDEDRVDNHLQADAAEDTQPQLRSRYQDGQTDSEGFYGEVMKSLRKSGMMPKEFNEHILYNNFDNENIPNATEQGITVNNTIDLKNYNDTQKCVNTIKEPEDTSHPTNENQEKDFSVECTNDEKSEDSLINIQEDTTNFSTDVYCDSDFSEPKNTGKKYDKDMDMLGSIKLIQENDSTDPYSFKTASEDNNNDIFYNKGSIEKFNTIREPEDHTFAYEQSEQRQKITKLINDTQSGKMPEESQEDIPFIDSENENIPFTTELETTENSTIDLKFHDDIQEFKNATIEFELTSHSTNKYQDNDITGQCTNDDKILIKSEDSIIDIQENTKSYTSDVKYDSDFSEQSHSDKKYLKDMVMKDSIKMINEDSLTDSSSSASNSDDINSDMFNKKVSKEKLDEPDDLKFVNEQSEREQRRATVCANTELDSKALQDQDFQSISNEKSIDSDST